MRETELAVRPGPNAEVVAKTPVIEVVAAGVATARIGRHLVAPQASAGAARGDAVQHVVGQVLVGQRRRVFGKNGVGLKRELIDRQMRRRVAQGGVEVALQHGQGLARQGVHQVQVEVLEVLRRFCHGGVRLRRIVCAAQGLQAALIKGLHPHAQARDAGGAVGGKALALEGAGVGLQRDFGLGQQRQQAAQIGQQALDRFGRQQAGRAAAQKHAVHRAPPDQRQAAFEVGAQRLQVARPGQGRVRVGPGVRVEVAIGAFFDAPGQVHVERERRQGAQVQGTGALPQQGPGFSHGQTSARASAPAWRVPPGRGGCGRF